MASIDKLFVRMRDEHKGDAVIHALVTSGCCLTRDGNNYTITTRDGNRFDFASRSSALKFLEQIAGSQIPTVSEYPQGSASLEASVHMGIPSDIDLHFHIDIREPAERHAPPQAEKLLSILLPPNRLEETLGDFEEGYTLMLDRYGLSYARRWYWMQVGKVAVRGIADAAYRLAKVWSGFGPA